MQLRILALALSLGLGACATAPKKTLPSGIQQGQNFSFSLPNLEGQQLGPKNYQGKVVLVDFWATWCKPCEASFPFYSELKNKYAQQGFEILAVSVDTEDEVVKNYLETKPMPFVVLRDPEGSLASQVNLNTMPTAILLSRSGKISYVHQGFVPEDQKTMEAKLQELLQEAPGTAAP